MRYKFLIGTFHFIFFLSFGFASNKIPFPPGLDSDQHVIFQEQSIQEIVLEQWESIKNLSETIQAASDQDEILELFNKRAISYFFVGELDAALADFNHVLRALVITNLTRERTLIGTALWGRMLCHAFKNNVEGTYNDARMIQYFFIDCIPCKQNTENIIPSVYHLKNKFFIPIAKFKNPDEKISPDECRSRVHGVANAMKTITLKINRTDVQWIVNYTIDQIAEQAYDCCKDAPEWTNCLGPIVDMWHKLQDVWSKLVDMANEGVRIAPYLVGPGR